MGLGGEITHIIAYDMSTRNGCVHPFEMCVYLCTMTRKYYKIWIWFLMWIHAHIWSRFMH